MTSRPHPALRVDRLGPVLTLTLDDPDRRNAQTPSLWAALAEVGEHLPADVRVVLLRGDGPSFSAGLDRRMLTAGGVPGEARGPLDRFQRAFTVWSQVPAVVIAAVQGHAIGAGFQLALAADLRVVGEDVAFAMRETSLGLVPDLGGTATLVHLVGYARALEICATGRFVGADEAVRLGLAQLAVPVGELEEAARDLADALLEAPDTALRELKPLLRKAIDAIPEDQWRHEREAQARLLAGLGWDTAGPAPH